MSSIPLLPESVVRENGKSPEVELGASQGKSLLVTLGVTRILERETLEVTILGSQDRTSWQPLATFPRKYYCGTYSLALRLSQHPDVTCLRVQWNMSRWDQSKPKPVFAFYVSMEELRARVAGAA
jgi:hypothetical protein